MTQAHSARACIGSNGYRSISFSPAVTKWMQQLLIILSQSITSLAGHFKSAEYWQRGGYQSAESLSWTPACTQFEVQECRSISLGKFG